MYSQSKKKFTRLYLPCDQETITTSVPWKIGIKIGVGLSPMFVQYHGRPSTCASAASAWGSQKVMSMARYIAMAVDSSARACSCRPVLAYHAPLLLRSRNLQPELTSITKVAVGERTEKPKTCNPIHTRRTGRV